MLKPVKIKVPNTLIEIWRALTIRRVGLAGLILLSCLVVIAVFAPYIAPYDPYARSGAPFERPSAKHLLGTNDVGQDILSELIYGTRVSLFIGFVAALIGTLLGTIIGLTAGFVGGLADSVLSALTDIWLSLPQLLFAIFLTAILLKVKGFTPMYAVILAIALTSWPSVARVIRSATISLKERPYIEAARAVGASGISIMFKHILPNVSSIMVAEIIYRTSGAMLSEAALSFLGLGDPTVKSWGMMIHYAMARYAVLLGYWWWFLPPGIMISISVLALLFIGMSLEEYLNPRLRQKQ